MDNFQFIDEEHYNYVNSEQEAPLVPLVPSSDDELDHDIYDEDPELFTFLPPPLNEADAATVKYLIGTYKGWLKSGETFTMYIENRFNTLELDIWTGVYFEEEEEVAVEEEEAAVEEEDEDQIIEAVEETANAVVRTVIKSVPGYGKLWVDTSSPNRGGGKADFSCFIDKKQQSVDRRWNTLDIKSIRVDAPLTINAEKQIKTIDVQISVGRGFEKQKYRSYSIRMYNIDDSIETE